MTPPTYLTNLVVRGNSRAKLEKLLIDVYKKYVTKD